MRAEVASLVNGAFNSKGKETEPKNCRCQPLFIVSFG
jgi:hypothetical protein